MSIRLGSLNQLDADQFVDICGRFFEHSSWIARAVQGRPFACIADLHQAMCQVVTDAPVQQKLALIRAHPDLVGRLAKQGRLTAESTTEQAAAGLNNVTPLEAETFDRYNAEYQHRFGFPFVICARENRKESILSAFPRRLQNTRELEIETALSEICKIAGLRIADAITED